MDLNELKKKFDHFGYYITKCSDTLYSINEYGHYPRIFNEFYTKEMLEEKLEDLELEEIEFDGWLNFDPIKDMDIMKEEYKDILEDEEDGK